MHEPTTHLTHPHCSGMLERSPELSLWDSPKMVKRLALRHDRRVVYGRLQLSVLVTLPRHISSRQSASPAHIQLFTQGGIELTPREALNMVIETLNCTHALACTLSMLLMPAVLDKWSIDSCCLVKDTGLPLFTTITCNRISRDDTQSRLQHHHPPLAARCARSQQRRQHPHDKSVVSREHSATRELHVHTQRRLFVGTI